MRAEFRLPIDDRHDAEFWIWEWDARFHETQDHAFKEAADLMRHLIESHFDDEDDND